MRSYQLIYLDQHPGLADQLPLNGVSLLSQIKVTGHDGEQTEELPPLEFGYSQFEPQQRDFFPLEGRALPTQSLGSPDTELVDLFGNGLPDILQMNGVVRYWRNLGDGQFDLPRQMSESPAGLQLADPGVQLIDANGDGRTDLLVTTPGLSGYFPLRFGGLWDRRSFQKYPLAPSFNLQDPEVKLIDLNGDGVTDAIWASTRLELFFNDPKNGWDEALQVGRKSLDTFPNINFSNPHVKWADMSGDGLQDAVLVHNGNVEYWPNLGYGRWGRRISMRRSPRLPYNYNPQRILIGDVDGDGLADLVYVDFGQVLLWINQGGNGWSEPIEINGTPDVADLDAVRLIDLFGSGISGLLWSRDAAESRGRDNYFFLDFTGSVKPYLLTEMNNNMGAITRVSYASSTQYYLADQKAAETHWQTSLPFPVQVVSHVEVIDEISGGKLTTEYRYHHGYWDGAEREFRGFGMVEQLDTETFARFNEMSLHDDGRGFNRLTDVQHYSPPTLTKSWFHQGPIGDEFGEWEEPDYSLDYWVGEPQVLERPHEMVDFLRALPRRARRDALRTLRGQPLRIELYALDGTDRQNRPYTITESLPGLREEAGAAGGDQRVFFPHVLAQRITQWERGDEPMTSFSFTADYDAYGQPQTQIAVAVPRGRDFRTADLSASEPYLVTASETTYAQRDDSQHYIVDRVARTTNYEIINNGTESVFDLVRTIQNGSAKRKIFGQTLNFYDGEAFVGRLFGELGDFGALVRTETLILTDDLVVEAYKPDAAAPDSAERPIYLEPEDDPIWSDEYPEAFRSRLPPLAGYTYHTGGGASPYASGYFATTAQSQYDFQVNANRQGHGLPVATRNPLGLETTIVYDKYKLLPVQVTDPVGLTTTAAHDYRVLQPSLVTDLNGNRTAFAFTPLGLMAKSAMMGKEGEAVGDTLAVPGTQLVYDFLAFVERRQPISVRTIQRVHHVHDLDASPVEKNETIEKIEYSDGFGRLLQTRIQSEDVSFGEGVFGNDVLPADQSITPGDAVGRVRSPDDLPNVVVSGWQTYNNKGWVVEKYEPFFGSGWAYVPPTNAELGQKAVMFYDPRGQVIRTVNPDGSEQRVVFGVPFDLTNPDDFVPTPWGSYTYDANDNAGRTHPDEVRAQHHWDTPISTQVDALGRTVQTVERNRHRLSDGTWTDVEIYVTDSTYDIRGNLLTVTDPLGRLNFRHVYDLANNPMRIENIDAGVRRIVLDAAGNEIERRDSKGALILNSYDELNRPNHLWARAGADGTVTLRQRLVYGESAEADIPNDEARLANVLGKLVRHYDEAGLVTLERCDFKGNVLEKNRQVISDEQILQQTASDPSRIYVVDWQPPAGTSLVDHARRLLDPTTYRTSTTYDGLNRIKMLAYPEGVTGQRQVLQPHYNRAGALEQVALDDATYVDHIAYNAKGQRTLIAYGNGILTRHAYDPQTFRLARMRSERVEKPADTAFSYRPVAPNLPLQELSYTYDLAGNILRIVDRTPGSGVQDNPEAALAADPHLAALIAGGNALERRFVYDPLNRLVSATGRECKSIPQPRPWSDDPRCGANSGNHGTPNQENAPNLTTTYREEYSYDPAGNMLTLGHYTNGQSWTRHFGMGGLTPDAWDRQWQDHLGDEVWHNAPGNRLTHAGNNDPTAPQTHVFDANGNLVRENGTRHFHWDYSDQLRAFRNQAGDAEPTIHAHYLYDAAGQRVKKLACKPNGDHETTVYIDGLFEHHFWEAAGGPQQNIHLHIMDDQQRISLARVGDRHPDDRGPAVQFHLGDHLGSSSLMVDEIGTWVNREEYLPYGESSFGSHAKKRYRYTGKERDEERVVLPRGAVLCAVVSAVG
ncbi:VCBS repeat-containing protein [Chloroflexi bacterium TSY]|nr:VCBS repeat-containing protein [Chloroflexi bacterium TSY]